MDGVPTTPNASIFETLQTIALEFRVHQRLDGVTPSPPFILPPNVGAITDPDSGCVVIDVDRLGLVDLTGGGLGGNRADRIVREILVVGPTPVAVTPGTIGRSFDGVPDPGGQLGIPVGAIGIESSNCIFVPCTAQLQLNGINATPGNPILVRICVWQPNFVEALAEMIKVCCCRAGVVDDVGDPFYTRALYPASTCTRTVTSVNPDSGLTGSGVNPLNIGGTGFAEGDIVYFINQTDSTQLTVTSTVFVSSVQIQVIVDIPIAASLGNYIVVVAPPLAPVQCQGVLLDAFLVVEP